MPGSIDSLDPSDGFMDFLRATHFNKGQASQGEDSDDGKSGSGSGSMPFSGTAYVAGHKTTGLGAKAWVRCFLDAATASDHDGPAPNPFPPNEEWYEVSKTPGDIHISRA